MIRLVNEGVKVDGISGSLHLTTTGNSLESSGNLTVHAGSVLTVTGALIGLNGSSCGFFRSPDLAFTVGAFGSLIQLFPAGSPTVKTGC